MKIINKNYIIAFIIMFLIGNRCYSIFQYNSGRYDMLQCILKMVTDFLPSFSSSYLGYSFNVSTVALIMSIGAGLATVVAMIYSSMNKKQYMGLQDMATLMKKLLVLGMRMKKTISPIQRTSLYQ